MDSLDMALGLSENITKDTIKLHYEYKGNVQWHCCKRRTVEQWLFEYVRLFCLSYARYF